MCISFPVLTLSTTLSVCFKRKKSPPSSLLPPELSLLQFTGCVKSHNGVDLIEVNNIFLNRRKRAVKPRWKKYKTVVLLCHLVMVAKSSDVWHIYYSKKQVAP